MVSTPWVLGGGGIMFKDKIISIFLALTILLKILDLYHDYSEQVELRHLTQELTLILLAAGLFLYIVFDIRARSRAMSVLKRQVGAAKVENRVISEQLVKAKRHFSEAMKAEFEAWGLTPSEQEVCLLLLKGFSLAEIAALRNVSEKTVRHHASAIYRKSDCPGRYQLAAHFFDALN